MKKINKCISVYCTTRKKCLTWLRIVKKNDPNVLERKFTKTNFGSGSRCGYYEEAKI